MTAQPGSPPPLPPQPGPRASRWPAGVSGLSRALHSISDAISALQRDQVVLRSATIISFTGSPRRASILLAGVQLDGIPYLSSYSPTIGDTVDVLQTRGQLKIIGS